jgi:hypothetical protein
MVYVIKAISDQRQHGYWPPLRLGGLKDQNPIALFLRDNSCQLDSTFCPVFRRDEVNKDVVV